MCCNGEKACSDQCPSRPQPTFYPVSGGLVALLLGARGRNVRAMKTTLIAFDSGRIDDQDSTTASPGSVSAPVSEQGLPRVSAFAAWSAAVMGITLLSGCVSPLPEKDDPAVLRAQLMAEHDRQLQASAKGPVIELEHKVGAAEERLKEKGLLEELEKTSGAKVYIEDTPEISQNTAGQDTEFAPLTLQQAVQSAVEHNIDLAVARLVPAISRAQVTRAEAAFDAVFFGSAGATRNDQPTPNSATGSFGSQSLNYTARTGIRQPLTSGGQVSLELGWAYTDQKNSNFLIGIPDTYHSSDLTLQVVQPLLRGFGEDVNTASIAVARNAAEREVYELKSNLIQVIGDTETAYWDLRFAHQNWRIQAKLLEREIAERDRLLNRESLDLSPAAASELFARAASQEATVLLAEENVRAASRQLKRLINSPDLPMGDLTVVDPITPATEEAIGFSYHDAMDAALKHRPEVAQAILDIDDSGIRQRVADNNHLPQLDLSGAVRWQGLDEDDAGPAVGEAVDVFDNNFIDYILQLEFEQAIGNRDAEALYGQRRLEKQASVKTYQRTVQDIQLEVQNALGNVVTAFKQIAARYNARIAAADSVRAINAQEEAGVALSPEFVSEKLNRLERLASAESTEAQAHTAYNQAVSDLYRVMGTLLERNQINFNTD